MSKYEEAQTANLMASQALTGGCKIDLRLSVDDLKHLYALAKACPQALLTAIGYLTSYGVAARYDEVYIHRNHDYLMACYQTKAGQRFVMGGVWRAEESKFTFHS